MWIKIDDSYFTHRKIVQLTGPAILMDLTGIAYCARELTDGYVADGAVLLVSALAKVGDPAPHVEELARVVRWERGDGGWWIHDYLDYQPSKKQVLELREIRAEVGRKGGRASGEARSKLLEMRSKLSSKIEANTEAKSNPASRIPIPVIDSPDTSLRSVRASKPSRNGKHPQEPDGFEEIWDSYPRHTARAKAAEAYGKLAPDEDTRQAIIKGIIRSSKNPSWHRDGGQFIPHLSTYLNGRRWEDEETGVLSPTLEDYAAEELAAVRRMNL